jgi:membrane peptidoglycan carboxypeptidase
MESNDSSDINKITLECFINKNCKDKYLKNHNKAKYDELNEKFDNIQNNREKILDLFTQYLDNKDFQVNTTLDELFQNFVKAYFQHMDFINTENNNKYFDYDKEEDDDVLFGTINEDPVTSFWGKGVKKI